MAADKEVLFLESLWLATEVLLAAPASVMWCCSVTVLFPCTILVQRSSRKATLWSLGWRRRGGVCISESSGYGASSAVSVSWSRFTMPPVLFSFPERSLPLFFCVRSYSPSGTHFAGCSDSIRQPAPRALDVANSTPGFPGLYVGATKPGVPRTKAAEVLLVRVGAWHPVPESYPHCTRAGDWLRWMIQMPRPMYQS